MKINRSLILFISIAVLAVVAYFVFFTTEKVEVNVQYIHNEGKAQGTYYSATYQHPKGLDLQKEIDQFFLDFDLSLSTYNTKSIITQINQNIDTVKTDDYFETMFAEAQKVSKMTNGAFDITVGPLVNAWGFGFKEADITKRPDITKLMPYIGYEKVRLVNHKIIKDDPAIILDASAIAQGLSADLVAQLFQKHGCENYMIDIGGEISCKGKNPKGKNWQIGVDKPIDDPENANGELQTILSVTNLGLTTSGNYRKFYYQGGKKYAHTIDPRTGFPVQHNLLSATVIAPTSMQADAYATAMMVLGKDSALILCNKIPNMDCYLIYTDKNGDYQVVYTKGFEKYINK